MLIKPNLPNNTNRWKSYMQEILKKIPSSEKQKESSYLAFNNSINDFLGKMRIVQRSLNEKNEGLNSDLDDLEREAGFVLDRYNNFVD
jgi:polyhydroxyalkanoate synthesis regulator phasin